AASAASSVHCRCAIWCATVHPGAGVGMGSDYTLFATAEGFVQFGWGRGGRKVINVVPENPNGH
ncbi:MAG TPA: 50S ribosomal protein L27, partial [Aggregatilineales bacterium]|nr:50S ribosomal protein L27 [Aggregatilineales bacterium]